MSATPDAAARASTDDTLDSISAELRALLVFANGQPLSLHEIEQRLHDRGYALLALFLAAPFPIPSIPGLSVPFGIAIFIIGFAFMLRRRPRLPRFILRKKVGFSTLQKVIPFLVRLMERLERRMKPRLRFLVSGPIMSSLLGLGLVSGGFFLALPLPIPLTNAAPALSIIFLIAGHLGRDGFIVLIGHALGVVAWVYLAAWMFFGAYLMPKFHALWDWITRCF